MLVDHLTFVPLQGALTGLIKRKAKVIRIAIIMIINGIIIIITIITINIIISIIKIINNNNNIIKISIITNTTFLLI